VVAKDSEGQLRIGHVSVLAADQVRFVAVDPPGDHPLVKRFLRTERGKLLSWFAGDFLYPKLDERADGATLLMSDAKYGLYLDPTRTLMGVTVRFDAAGKIIEVERKRPGQDGLEMGAEFDALLRLIKTGR